MMINCKSTSRLCCNKEVMLWSKQTAGWPIGSLLTPGVKYLINPQHYCRFLLLWVSNAWKGGFTSFCFLHTLTHFTPAHWHSGRSNLSCGSGDGCSCLSKQQHLRIFFFKGTETFPFFFWWTSHRVELSELRAFTLIKSNEIFIACRYKMPKTHFAQVNCFCT